MVATLGVEIVEHLDHLRACARSLARDRALADDLVQEAVLRALVHADHFRPGSNLRAWLSTILRNAFFDEKRAEKRRMQFVDALASAPASTKGEQEARLAMQDVCRAFARLPAGQRTALALVGAEGFSYEEAARQAGCTIGTVKSRASRARVNLHRLLDADEGRAANDAASGGLWRPRAA
ncbi:MAG TPA: sigma-70 family RNA polymerase sigma factor [Stellaceae bacterium]|nr:sigma-70 family RNA polymerase sigma factor [Stellaceae bacterium]